MNKLCPSCDHKLPTDAKFCSNCGISIAGQSTKGSQVSIRGNVGRDVMVAGRDIIHSQSRDSVTTALPFEAAKHELASLDLEAEEKQTATLALEKLEEQDGSGEAKKETVNRWFTILEAIAPTVAKVLIEAILSPGAAASTAMKAILDNFKKK